MFTYTYFIKIAGKYRVKMARVNLAKIASNLALITIDV